MFSTNMTSDEWQRAWEHQHSHDLNQAKMLRDHYQREVDRLEANGPHKVTTP